MNERISTYIDGLPIDKLPTERTKKLLVLIEYIQRRSDADEPIRLNFICTHNSRRSHLCQVWAKTIANYHGIEKVKCYSGGTEATAVFPVVIETLKNIGFAITKISNYTNPTYKVSFSQETNPMTLFSKRFNDYYNPKKDFAAVMTCTDADENCPIIPGAIRVTLPYSDPKESDGTDQQVKVYAERSKQIATEMNYIFSRIK
ncbi:protein-tyrosine-phosphatase [Bacteroidia bacterium]|jgi:arsenate reductase|nr:protein-tyrosine-phosphatase [Bacteroidia bacterium]